MLVLLPIIAVLVVAAGSPAGQRGVNDNAANIPATDANGPYDPVPNWFKPLHAGKVQCVSGVAAEIPTAFMW